MTGLCAQLGHSLGRIIRDILVDFFTKICHLQKKYQRYHRSYFNPWFLCVCCIGQGCNLWRKGNPLLMSAMFVVRYYFRPWWLYIPEGLCNIGYLSKLTLNSNLVKTLSFITPISVIQSFWNFAQSMAVILPCSVQNFKMNGQLR